MTKKVEDTEKKKLKGQISDALEEKFKELEFEEFLEDTADYVMNLNARVKDLESEVFND